MAVPGYNSTTTCESNVSLGERNIVSKIAKVDLTAHRFRWLTQEHAISSIVSVPGNDLGDCILILGSNLRLNGCLLMGYR